MKHRHLNHQTLTTAAIDDSIERGSRADWVGLRNAAAADPVVLEKILRACAAHAADPYAQRYHLWRLYADRSVA